MVAALAQHQSGSNFGTTCVATFSPATTSGRLLTLAIQDQQATDITGVTDSAGNVWKKATSLEVTTQKHTEIWYAANALSCTTVTATLGGTSGNANMSIQEWSGTGSWSLAAASSASNASSTTPAENQVTVTAGDVVLAALGYLEAVSGTRQDTVSDGTLLDALARGTTAFSSAYKITAAATVDGCNWTFSPGVSSVVSTASFGPTGGGGGGLNPVFRIAASNNHNDTNPNIIVPSSCGVGDLIVVQYSQNNTDVQTAAPAGLTQIDVNTTTATFPNRLYWGIVGSGGITAGGTLSWTLSAIRAWDVLLIAYYNADTSAAPVFTAANTVATGLTATTPNLTTSVTRQIIELVSGKSSTTAVTTWTPPAGWTSRASIGAFQGFAGTGIVAEKNGGASVAGTYGSDVYTADQNIDVAVKYTIGIKGGTGGVPPTANAGPDQSVDPWSTVTLDGSASSDPDGTITQYTWSQTAGTTVTLSNIHASNPTFTAPGSLSVQTLTFSLVVTDNAALTSSADTVDITVYPATEAYPNGGVWKPLEPIKL